MKEPELLTKLKEIFSSFHLNKWGKAWYDRNKFNTGNADLFGK